MSRLIRHWVTRSCLTTHPKGDEYLGIRKNDEASPYYKEGFGEIVYYCTHKNCENLVEQGWKKRVYVLRHWQDNHFEDAKEYTTCKEEGCGMRYVAAALLQLHMASKHKDDPCSCSFCGKLFTIQSTS